MQNDLVENEVWNVGATLADLKSTPYCQKKYQELKDRFDELQRYAGVSKFRIVFIGEPGVGKSTVICNWLKLLTTEKRLFRISEFPLLKTASGRTTASEVHIRQSDEQCTTTISLEYLPIPEQEKYIRTFCEYYYGAFCVGADLAVMEEHDPCVERNRMIRNMAKLDECQKQIKDCGDLESFYQLVLKRVDLPRRMLDYMVYEDNARESFREWLKQKFGDINYGLNPKCAIPERVNIDISIKDFDLGLPEYVKDVVDTIGLDTDSKNRPDLNNYLNSTDTICFVLNKIQSIPSVAVSNLLRNSLTKKDWQILSRVSILAKCSDRELSAVNESEGVADVGRSIKQAELHRVVQERGLPYVEENTFWIDPCMAYDVKHEGSEEIVEIDFEYADMFSTAFNYRIKMMIEKYRDALVDKLKSLQKEAQALLRDARSLYVQPINNRIRYILGETADYDQISESTVKSYEQGWESCAPELVKVYPKYLQSLEDENNAEELGALYATLAKTLRESLGVPAIVVDKIDPCLCEEILTDSEKFQSVVKAYSTRLKIILEEYLMSQDTFRGYYDLYAIYKKEGRDCEQIYELALDQRFADEPKYAEMQNGLALVLLKKNQNRIRAFELLESAAEKKYYNACCNVVHSYLFMEDRGFVDADRAEKWLNFMKKNVKIPKTAENVIEKFESRIRFVRTHTPSSKKVNTFRR